jgi:hypothetical protein
MKLSIAIASFILSSVTPAITATKEEEVDLLVKKVDELTAVVEAQELKLQQLLSPSQNDRRFLAKSSKSKPAPSCTLTQKECADLKNGVVDHGAHQSSDVSFVHTELCQTFQYLLQQAGQNDVTDGLLKAMHCETSSEDIGTQYEMFDMSDRRDNWYPVTNDPLGAEYQACSGFLNVGKCSGSNYSCLWFTNGYIANTHNIASTDDPATKCSQYCEADPFCKASFYLQDVKYEQVCKIIHVAPTIGEPSSSMCAAISMEDCLSRSDLENWNRIFVKQDEGSDCAPLEEY